uniref:RE35117p n=1 Tax=Drosophila melanogaster TaxID=7227 RepID=C5WLV1_DROME|nr:RE35117p [Drosophila melanogaster]
MSNKRKISTMKCLIKGKYARTKKRHNLSTKIPYKQTIQIKVVSEFSNIVRYIVFL